MLIPVGVQGKLSTIANPHTVVAFQGVSLLGTLGRLVSMNNLRAIAGALHPNFTAEILGIDFFRFHLFRTAAQAQQQGGNQQKNGRFVKSLHVSTPFRNGLAGIRIAFSKSRFSPRI